MALVSADTDRETESGDCTSNPTTQRLELIFCSLRDTVLDILHLSFSVHHVPHFVHMLLGTMLVCARNMYKTGLIGINKAFGMKDEWS